MWSFAGIYWRTADNKENVFFTDSSKNINSEAWYKISIVNQLFFII